MCKDSFKMYYSKVMTKLNRRHVTNSNLIIHISLQPDGVKLRNFKGTETLSQTLGSKDIEIRKF